MKEVEPKKLYPFYILQTLQENEGKSFSVEALIAEVEKRYDVSISRNTMAQNLRLLQTLYPHCLTYTLNQMGNPTNWCWHNEKTDVLDKSEVNFLMSLIQSLSYVAADKKEILLDAVRLLGPEYGSHVVRERITGNREALLAFHKHSSALFRHMGIVAQAIAQAQSISFEVGQYNADGKVVSKNPKSYVYHVWPIFIAFKNDTIYLGAKKPFQRGEHTIYHYSLRLLKHIRIDPVPEDERKREEYEKHQQDFLARTKDFDLERYLNLHPLMWGEPVEQVQLSCKNCPTARKAIRQAFGDEAILLKEDDEQLLYGVHGNPQAVALWAVQYCSFFTVLSPDEVRQEVIRVLRNALSRYGAESH